MCTSPAKTPSRVSPAVSSQATSPFPEQVTFEPSWFETPGRLVERARPGDVVLTLGAGDVTLVGPEVLDLLSEQRSGGGHV